MKRYFLLLLLLSPLLFADDKAKKVQRLEKVDLESDPPRALMADHRRTH